MNRSGRATIVRTAFSSEVPSTFANGLVDDLWSIREICLMEGWQTMSTKVLSPEGYHSVTPYFTVPDADQFISFLVDAFDGSIVVEKRDENNLVQHARVRIGDTIIMLNEANENYSSNVSQMHLFVLDVEDTFASALSAGATTIMEPNVRPHGDRMAGVRDPCENIWWIASHS